MTIATVVFFPVVVALVAHLIVVEVLAFLIGVPLAITPHVPSAYFLLRSDRLRLDWLRCFNWLWLLDDWNWFGSSFLGWRLHVLFIFITIREEALLFSSLLLNRGHRFISEVVVVHIAIKCDPTCIS